MDIYIYEYPTVHGFCVKKKSVFLLRRPPSLSSPGGRPALLQSTEWPVQSPQVRPLFPLHLGQGGRVLVVGLAGPGAPIISRSRVHRARQRRHDAPPVRLQLRRVLAFGGDLGIQGVPIHDGLNGPL